MAANQGKPGTCPAFCMARCGGARARRARPCQGRGRGFESLRPLQKFSQSCRSIFGACDAAFPAADDVRSFSLNAGARPVGTEGRSPGRTMRLKFWPVALVAAAVLVSGWRTDALAQGYP